jgi:protein-disulfide isomerase
MTRLEFEGMVGVSLRCTVEAAGRTREASTLSFSGEVKSVQNRFWFLFQCLSLLCFLGAEVFPEGVPKNAPLALINGDPISAKEVEMPLGAQISKLEEQIYALKRQRLEGLIQMRLLAKEASKRGLSIPALLEAEVTTKISPVTDQEIETHYQANKAKYPGDNYRQTIQSQLENQRRGARQQAFIQALRAQANIVINLKPPPVYRADVSAQGAPIRGSENAPVTIIEFSDFHCPYCKQVQPTLKRILSDYGDRVKLAYRDFPIDQLHPNARKAAEAARCANDQGKFWEFHDKLYGGGTDASPETLTRLAREIDMDVVAFQQCIAVRKHGSGIDRDIEEATKLGVNGTPGFFINGRLVSGAQPYEGFAQVINEELAHAAQNQTTQSPR